MYRSVRFQLRAKPSQEACLRRWAGQARWLWNQALSRQIQRRNSGESYANYVAMAKWLTEWRNGPETAWLAQSPVHVQQQVLKRLDQAFQRFFANVKVGKKPGFPRFKAYGNEPGLRFPDAKQIQFDAGTQRIKLPKLGWVRVRQSKGIPSAIANASLTRDGAKWYVSLQYSMPDVLPAAVAPTLGLDMGVANFYTTSDGCRQAPLDALKRQAVRLARYQRSVARKKKGSNNRKKAVQRLATLHRRIARQRNDWLHQRSTALAREHAVIVLEDLNIANMSRSAAGTIEAPGRNVKAKAGLNRAILDQGWSAFRGMLAYKLQANGGQLIVVPPAYTSQRCCACGFTHADNRQTQARFQCLECGHNDHADVNAAKNILAAGHAVYACGGDVRRLARKRTIAAPAKQEPTEAPQSTSRSAVGIPALKGREDVKHYGHEGIASEQAVTGALRV